MGDRNAQEAVSVVFCHDYGDAGDFDPNPAETRRRDIELVTHPTTPRFAAIGWGAGGMRAAELAATEGSNVTRLVLCGVPAPDVDSLSFDLSGITAKTLLLYGQLDADAPPRHAQWWKDHLPHGARVEIVPGRGNDFIGGMWGRVLSHAAPGSLRRQS